MPGRIRSIAQKPIAIAAAVRTNCARVIPILPRQRSVSASASCMIARCALLGGGGKYSSFDAGRMSTGRPSGMSGHECLAGPPITDGPQRFQLIISSPHTDGVPCLGASLHHLERAAHERMDTAVIGHDLTRLETVLG